MFSSSVVRFIQGELNARGHPVGKPDGRLGPRTETGLRECLVPRRAELPASWEPWPRTRLFTAYVQLRCKDEGENPGPVDGLWGTQTDFAVEAIRQRIQHEVVAPNFRDVDETPVPAAGPWPHQSQDSVRAFFGDVGSRLTRLELPFEHRLAWDRTQRIRAYSCHEKVHDSLGRVLTGVLEHYGESGIRELRLDLFGGCYNKRKKKGGDTWSMHAWGIAVDYDPENNQFRWGWEKAAFARSDYARWWQIWEDEGWVSLGRTRNFDWMHIQAAHF